MKYNLIAWTLAALVPLNTQTSARPNPVPSTQVVFSTSDGTSIALPSIVMTQLPVCYSANSCSADFAPGLQQLTKQVVAHFDISGTIHAVDPATIQSLFYVQVLSSTPTDDGVAVLVHGAASDSTPSLQLVPKLGAQPKRSGLKDGNYVCFFDHDGEPESVEKLNPRYKPAKIAYLGEEQVLLLLFDSVNERTVLATMKPDEGLVRFLDDQGSLTGSSALMKNSGLGFINRNSPEFMKQIAMVQSLSGWQFGYAAKRLLMLQPGTSPIVWSISSGGAIRKVKLTMPPGTTAASIVSSDGPWLIRSFVLPTPSQVQILLEFDPETGKLMRRIKTKVATPSSILFAKNGHYYAFWWDKSKHPWILESE